MEATMDIRVRTGNGTFAVIPPVGVGLVDILKSYTGRIKAGNVSSMTIAPTRGDKTREEKLQLLKERDTDLLAMKINRHISEGKTVVLTLR